MAAPMRASDQDRQEAVLALSDQYAEGRLDREEFDRRQALALEATYLHDLDPLFADLPGRVSPTTRAVAAAASAAAESAFGPRPGLRRGRRGRPPLVLGLVVSLVVLGVVTGSHLVWLLLVPAMWFTMALRARRYALAYAGGRDGYPAPWHGHHHRGPGRG